MLKSGIFTHLFLVNRLRFLSDLFRVYSIFNSESFNSHIINLKKKKDFFSTRVDRRNLIVKKLSKELTQDYMKKVLILLGSLGTAKSLFIINEPLRVDKLD